MAPAQGYEPWGDDSWSWDEQHTAMDRYVMSPAPDYRTEGAHQYRIEIVDRQPDYYADVEIQNQIVQAIYTARVLHFHRPDGLIITVVAEQAEEFEPDYFYVVPPPGYCAIPIELTLTETEMGIIQIHPCTFG
jgi:hypothetical protein